MKLDKFIEKYDGKILQDAGAVNSEQFLQFALEMRSALKDELKKIGASFAKFEIGHYYIFGFIERNDKYVYFDYNEPRLMKLIFDRADTKYGIMIRTAKSKSDYAGGPNWWTNFDEFANFVDKLLKEQENANNEGGCDGDSCRL